MLESAKIMAFVGITDVARARAFYEGTLGLPVVSDDPFALVFDVNGTTLRAAKVGAAAPPPYTTLGWTVADVEGTVRALTAKGVAFERYPGMEQYALGIWQVHGGKVAWFKDPDGNLLSLSSG